MNKRKRLFFEIGMAIILAIAMIVLITVYADKKREAELANMINNTKVVLYEGPKSLRDATDEDLKAATEKARGMELLHSTDTRILVNGLESYVYETSVNHTRVWAASYMPPQSRTPMTYFDFDGTAVITLSVPNQELNHVKISPLSYEIEPEIDKENHTVTFTITRPDSYTIMFENAPERAVHIFANPIEENIPSPDDENVVYIEPGEWDIESIILEEGQTLYISGGAVINGVVNANYVKDITVRGRGIINGSNFEGWKGQIANIPLKFDHCTNTVIKDVIVLNSNAWVCQAFHSSEGVIDGLKIISSRPNGDGITIQSCQNYEISNCFVRSWDDSLVVKNYDTNSEHIFFKNIQIWTDLAQSMEVGYETNKGNKDNAFMKNITFENILVLQNYHKPIISIHNADDAIVEDILFENITVEEEQVGSGDADVMPYLIDLNIESSNNWSTTKERGIIKDVVIRNVKVLSGTPNASRISGYDASCLVENVTIENLELFGKKITTFTEGNFEVDQETTANITIK